MIEKIISGLRSHRFILDNEKHLQEQIHTYLRSCEFGHQVQREVRLSDDGANIIDFTIEKIGIEVKLRYPKRRIYKQLERYCCTGRLTDIILMSSTSIGLPQQIEGVNIYLINPSIAWL